VFVPRPRGRTGADQPATREASDLRASLQVLHGGMQVASPRLTTSQRILLLGAVALLSCAALGFQVLQVVVLSLQLFPEAAFLVVSLSMLGLGSGGSLAIAFAPRHASGSPLGTLWGCAVGFSLTVLAATVATSRMHALLPLILVNTVPSSRSCSPPGRSAPTRPIASTCSAPASVARSWW
jgi:hypothetical protein